MDGHYYSKNSSELMLSFRNAAGNSFDRQRVGVCIRLGKPSLMEKNVPRADTDDARGLTRRDDDGSDSFRRSQNRRTRNARIRSIHLIE